jgi:hypothetical protein
LADLVSLPCNSTAFAGLSREILGLGKSLRFKAGGVSMQPLVRDGDILLVQPVGAERVRVGDVVLCSSQADRVLVHRVLRRLAGPEGPIFLVQGDQVREPDGWIPQAQVHGRLARIERAGTRIDMHSPAVRLLGRLAALRSSWQLGQSRWSLFATRLARHLPVFYKYLD